MEVVRKLSVSDNSAVALVAAACRKAGELGMAISVTVVDEAGGLKAFRRMDGAPLLSVSASRTKALTAVGFGMPTGRAWLDFIAGDPILERGVQSLQDFTLLGGGHPLFQEENLVGAIGVSGGHYSQDEECVGAALDAVGD